MIDILITWINEGVFSKVPVYQVSVLLLSIISWLLYGFFEGEIELNFDRKVFVLLSIILIFASVSRVLAPYRLGAEGGDELDYVSVAENVADRGEYTLEGESTYFKPYYMYIILVAPMTFFLSPIAAGRIINILISVLSVLGVYWYTSEFFDKNSGLIAAFVFSFLPSSLHLANTTESQVVSTFFILLFVPVFKRFLEKESVFWGLGSTLIFSAVVLSRSFNWIFVPLFVTIILFRKGFFKEYLVYGGVFIIFTWLSFVQNIPMAFRKGGGELAFFGIFNLFKNSVFFFRNIFSSVWYAPIFFLGTLGAIKAFKSDFRDLVLSPFLLFFITIMSYGYLQGYFLPKELYLISVGFTIFFSYYLNDFMDLKKIRNILMAFLVVFSIFNVSYSINKSSEKLLPSTRRSLSLIRSDYSGCGVLTYDGRAIRAVSDIKFSRVPESEQSWGWYQDKFGECIVFYTPRVELPEYVEVFEKRMGRDERTISVSASENSDWNTEILVMNFSGGH